MPRINEVAVTSTQAEMNGNLSTLCPHSDSSLANNWYEFALNGILMQQSGGKFKLPLDTAGRESLVVDKLAISSVTVTLT